MWQLYQKYGSFKKVAEKMNRGASTVSKYIHEYEAALGAAKFVMNSMKEV